MRGKPTLRGGSILDLPFDMFREVVNNMAIEDLYNLMTAGRLSADKYAYVKTVYRNAVSEYKERIRPQRDAELQRYRDLISRYRTELNQMMQTDLPSNLRRRISRDNLEELRNKIEEIRYELHTFRAQHPEADPEINQLYRALDQMEQKIERQQLRAL